MADSNRRTWLKQVTALGITSSKLGNVAGILAGAPLDVVNVMPSIQKVGAALWLGQHTSDAIPDDGEGALSLPRLIEYGKARISHRLNLLKEQFNLQQTLLGNPKIAAKLAPLWPSIDDFNEQEQHRYYQFFAHSGESLESEAAASRKAGRFLADRYIKKRNIVNEADQVIVRQLMQWGDPVDLFPIVSEGKKIVNDTEWLADEVWLHTEDLLKSARGKWLNVSNVSGQKDELKAGVSEFVGHAKAEFIRYFPEDPYTSKLVTQLDKIEKNALSRIERLSRQAQERQDKNKGEPKRDDPQKRWLTDDFQKYIAAVNQPSDHPYVTGEGIYTGREAVRAHKLAVGRS